MSFLHFATLIKDLGSMSFGAREFTDSELEEARQRLKRKYTSVQLQPTSTKVTEKKAKVEKRHIQTYILDKFKIYRSSDIFGQEQAISSVNKFLKRKF